jgi:type VII secretion protein EccB
LEGDVASRRDQLQSYQFLTQRVISAFVMRETDPAQSPLRRGVGAVFAGLMIALLVAGGYGIYGLLTKTGGNTWRVDGTVVVERETGASFVYQDGVLHPTLNFASALLAANRPVPVVARVANAALGGVPRGVAIGIPGAPNSLPPARMAVGLPWTLRSAGDGPTVTLAVGAPVGANALGERGLLVTDPNTGDVALVWHRHRYPLNEPKTVVPALFGAVVTPVPAGTAWLDALAAGADLGPLPVDGAGTASTAVPGRRVGDLLVAPTGSGPQYYLVLAGGLAPITALQKDIALAQFGVRPVEVSLAEADRAPRSTDLEPPSGDVAAPASTPTLAHPDSGTALCAMVTDAGSAPEVLLGGTVPGFGAAVPTGGGGNGPVLADRVLVPAGHIAVVRAQSAPGAPAGAPALVTDLGIRYPVPSDTVLRILGYDPARAVPVPAALLTLIPAGPTLDPAAALRPAPAGAPS